MLNMDEINQEINKLENCEYTTYDICKKLSILYTVRNNFKRQQAATQSVASTTPAIPAIK